MFLIPANWSLLSFMRARTGDSTLLKKWVNIKSEREQARGRQRRTLGDIPACNGRDSTRTTRRSRRSVSRSVGRSHPFIVHVRNWTEGEKRREEKRGNCANPQQVTAVVCIFQPGAQLAENGNRDRDGKSCKIVDARCFSRWLCNPNICWGVGKWSWPGRRRGRRQKSRSY